MPTSFKSVISVLLIAALLSACSSNRKETDRDRLLNDQVEELYQKAKRAMNNGNYFFALDYYRALEANFPYGRITEQAKLDMIYALDKSNQREQAVDAADNFIQLYPTHANVDYAYYMKGVASFAKKANRIDAYIKGGSNQVRDPKPLRDAEQAFLELIQRFPNSKYTEDAKQRIVYLRNRLAERELKIAMHYYQDRTYVASVNRCKHIIYQYETSPAVEGALLLMEQAYLEMGLNNLAASTRGILELNFPEHQAGNNIGKQRQKSFLGRLFSFNSEKKVESDFELPEFRGESRISQDQADDKPSLLQRLMGSWGDADESPTYE